MKRLKNSAISLPLFLLLNGNSILSLISCWLLGLFFDDPNVSPVINLGRRRRVRWLLAVMNEALWIWRLHWRSFLMTFHCCPCQSRCRLLHSAPRTVASKVILNNCLPLDLVYALRLRAVFCPVFCRGSTFVCHAYPSTTPPPRRHHCRVSRFVVMEVVLSTDCDSYNR